MKLAQWVLSRPSLCNSALLLLLLFTSALGFSQRSTDEPHSYPEMKSLTQYGLALHEDSEPSDSKAGLVPCAIHNYSHSWIHLSIRAAKFIYFEGTLGPQISEGSMWGEMVSNWPTDTVEIALPPQKYVIGLQNPYIEWTTFEVELERSKAFTYTIETEVVEDRNPVMMRIEKGPLVEQASQAAAFRSAVDSAIDRISRAAHQELPPPTQSSAVGLGVGWTFKNASGHQLTLYLSGHTGRNLSGVAQRKYKVLNGQTIFIDLEPGTYRIAVEVSDRSVLPYYAVRELKPDSRWELSFQIVS